MRRAAVRGLRRAADALRLVAPAEAALPRGALPPAGAAAARCCGFVAPRWACASRGLCSSAPPPAAAAAEACATAAPAERGGAVKAQGLSEAVLQSIVKVFTVHCAPSHFMPWQNKPQRESTGASLKQRAAQRSTADALAVSQGRAPSSRCLVCPAGAAS